MMSVDPKEIEKIQNMPLPPELEKVVSASRSQFFSELGLLYDKSTQHTSLIIKGLLTQMAKFESENKKLKDEVTLLKNRPNRKQRRAQEKKEAKA